MPTTRYCYHCQRHHPAEEMRQVDTKGRKKWRCIASIEAAKQGTEAREAYGRKISENNMAVSREKIKALLNPELKNQFSSEK